MANSGEPVLSCFVTKTEDSRSSWKMWYPEELWQLSLLGAAQPGTEQTATAIFKKATENQKGSMTLLEKCRKVSHPSTPKVCFLTKSVLLQHLHIRFLFGGHQ